MGGWFLSFAMANLLAGQIASITGSESHEEGPEDAKLTLAEALNQANEGVSFDDWDHLVFPSEDNNTISNNVDMSTYDNYLKWAVFSTAFQEEWTIAAL